MQYPIIIHTNHATMEIEKDGSVSMEVYKPELTDSDVARLREGFDLAKRVKEEWEKMEEER